MQVMTKTHYYLVDTSVILPGAQVSELQFNIVSEEPFFVHGLKVSTIISFNILKWGVFVLCPSSLYFHLLLNQLISDMFLLVDGAWLYFSPLLLLYFSSPHYQCGTARIIGPLVFVLVIYVTLGNASA